MSNYIKQETLSNSVAPKFGAKNDRTKFSSTISTRSPSRATINEDVTFDEDNGFILANKITPNNNSFYYEKNKDIETLEYSSYDFSDGSNSDCDSLESYEIISFDVGGTENSQRRCKKCGIFNSISLTICSMCEHALVANPCTVADASIAEQLKLKEEEMALEELREQENDCVDLMNENTYPLKQASIFQKEIQRTVGGINRAIQSNKDDASIGILRKLPETDTNMHLSQLIESVQANINQDKLCDRFVSIDAEFTPSDQNTLERIRKIGFTCENIPKTDIHSHENHDKRSDDGDQTHDTFYKKSTDQLCWIVATINIYYKEDLTDRTMNAEKLKLCQAKFEQCKEEKANYFTKTIPLGIYFLCTSKEIFENKWEKDLIKSVAGACRDFFSMLPTSRGVKVIDETKRKSDLVLMTKVNKIESKSLPAFRDVDRAKEMKEIIFHPILHSIEEGCEYRTTIRISLPKKGYDQNNFLKNFLAILSPAQGGLDSLLFTKGVDFLYLPTILTERGIRRITGYAFVNFRNPSNCADVIRSRFSLWSNSNFGFTKNQGRNSIINFIVQKEKHKVFSKTNPTKHLSNIDIMLQLGAIIIR